MNKPNVLIAHEYGAGPQPVWCVISGSGKLIESVLLCAYRWVCICRGAILILRLNRYAIEPDHHSCPGRSLTVYSMIQAKGLARTDNKLGLEPADFGTCLCALP